MTVEERRDREEHGVEATEAKVRGTLLPGLLGARKDAALSQRELARLAGTTQVTVHELEAGSRGAYPATLRKLSKALGVPPRALMEDPEENGDGET